MNKTEIQLIALLSTIEQDEPLTKTEKIIKVGLSILKRIGRGEEIPLSELRHHRYSGPMITTTDIEEIVKNIGGEIYTRIDKPGPAPKIIRRKRNAQ